MSSAHPPVPYGIGNFSVLRRDRFFYVDKTRFIRPLEHERFAFFVRPRRFGKSLWLTMLDAYYNRAAAGAFETAFAGTDIGENPTADHNRYVVLYFDFSAFKQALASLEENIEEYCQLHVQDALRRNRDLFDEEARRAILGPRSVNGQLNALFLHVRDRGIPLCVLIDEYDNFANTILSEQGADAYDSCTHGGGFYRNFFATLKAGTTEAGCIERLFVTGVSPVTMDDVTSGFNIGANLSLRPQFNAMLGFTEDEVREVLRIYSEAGALTESPDQALDTMREWYDGYRFSEDAPADVYNTDMVLYYLKESIALGGPPRRLIDRNVRVDYGKLRHLLVVSHNAAEKQRLARGGDVLNGNFDLLRRVVAEETAACELRNGFPLRELDRRENFLSLLHCFGLLSIRGSREGQPVLGIPNQTVRQLMYRILRDAYGRCSSTWRRRWRDTPASATTWMARRWCRGFWPRIWRRPITSCSTPSTNWAAATRTSSWSRTRWRIRKPGTATCWSSSTSSAARAQSGSLPWGARRPRRSSAIWTTTPCASAGPACASSAWRWSTTAGSLRSPKRSKPLREWRAKRRRLARVKSLQQPAAPRFHPRCNPRHSISHPCARLGPAWSPALGTRRRTF